MKTIFAFLFASLMAFGGQETTNVESYKVDTEASTIEWTGYKVTGSHTGMINLKEGSLEMVDGALVGGAFTIDMTSMTCTDLKGPMAKKLVGHLTSDDFFGTANFPTATFVITKVVPYGKDGSYKILGDLTIKETTKQIKFMTKIEKSDNGFTSSAKITVDRSEYDVKYGSGSFFDGLGDKTIYDEFELLLNLSFTK